MSAKRDFLSVSDLSPSEIRHLIQRARQMKEEGNSQPLRGKRVALLFEKPSLRTRVSFQIARPLFCPRNDNRKTRLAL